MQKISLTMTQGFNGLASRDMANHDKQAEKIKEQIQMIQENERYDADTKKSKIEELEKLLMEIEKAKMTPQNESPPNKKKKPERDIGTEDAATLELSQQAKTLIEAGNNLNQLKNAFSTKRTLENEANVLSAEIDVDKGRGVNTVRKEKQLSRIEAGIEQSSNLMGQTIKAVNQGLTQEPVHKEQASTKPDNENENSDSEENTPSADTAADAPHLHHNPLL